MKPIKKIILTFILFIAFTTAKAQIAIPASAGKTATPKMMVETISKNESELNSVLITMNGQTNTNVKLNKKAEANTKTETILTPQQKKQQDEDRANAKIIKITK